MKKVIYYFFKNGGYLCADCPGNCGTCQIRFRCYTESKNYNIDLGTRTDTVVIEDRELFDKFVDANNASYDTNSDT